MANPSIGVFTSKVPKITWGAAYVNTLTFFRPLDSVKAYSVPADQQKLVEARNREYDSIGFTDEQFLSGVVLWIPVADEIIGGVTVTGWDGLTGWRAWLEWARAKKAWKFYPDQAAGTVHNCYLKDPEKGEPERGFNNGVQLKLVMRDADNLPFDGY